MVPFLRSQFPRTTARALASGRSTRTSLLRRFRPFELQGPRELLDSPPP